MASVKSKSESSSSPRDKKLWAKWFVDHGFVIIPLGKHLKTPAIAWGEYTERKPTPEETQVFMQMVSEGYNYGVLGGHNNLVVLDFEDYSLAEKWILADELKALCETTLCVRTVHGGLHVYLIADDLPPQKFNPAFTREGKAVMDLQSVKSYVVGPWSCINHDNCETEKCPWRGQDITTCYEPLTPIEKARITKFNLRGLLNELIRRGEALGIKATPGLLNWLKESKAKEEQSTEGNKGAKAEAESKAEGKAEAIGGLRELSDSDLLKLVELLSEGYRPGRRQFIVLYLAGWLADSRIHPLSTVKLVKMLHEKTNDEDSLKTRLGAVVYTYKKAGINVDNWANEIEQLTGVKPYGIEREIREGEIKGKSGLQEILEEVLGEERALAIISEIEEILGTTSPWRDSILGIMNYEKQIYAIANLRKLIMARVTKVKDRMVYKEKVANVAPTKVVVYENPIDTIRKYQITFEGQVLRRPLTVGPATLDEIADRLKVEGGIVIHSRLLSDVLNTIVGVYIKTGRAEVRTEIEKPGFYIIDGKLIVVGYDYNSLDKERLKEALELLNELGNTWFKHVQDRFALIVKWGAIAPFSYIIKQRGKFLKWLYLYGDSATGKTTLGRIVLKLWGLEPRFEKTGASVDTVARLGQVLSQGTFPTLINEPGSALSKEDIVDTIKNAVDNTVARSKYVKGTYVDFPALAPLIFTSNRNLPNDDALARRLYIITFSFAEKIPQERQREFRGEVEPRLSLLAEVGKCIAGVVLENQQFLDLDPLEAGKQLLIECYNRAGLEPPEWLNLTYENEGNDIYEEIIELIRNYLVKRINEEFSRFVGKAIVEKPGKVEGEVVYDYKSREEIGFADRVMIVLSNNLLPWAILRDNNVLITVGFVKELQGVTGTIEGLKSIAELLGWDYTVAKIQGKNMKCAKVSLEKFIEFLNPPIEE